MNAKSVSPFVSQWVIYFTVFTFLIPVAPGTSRAQDPKAGEPTTKTQAAAPDAPKKEEPAADATKKEAPAVVAAPVAPPAKLTRTERALFANSPEAKAQAAANADRLRSHLTQQAAKDLRSSEFRWLMGIAVAGGGTFALQVGRGFFRSVDSYRSQIAAIARLKQEVEAGKAMYNQVASFLNPKTGKSISEIAALLELEESADTLRDIGQILATKGDDDHIRRAAASLRGMLQKKDLIPYAELEETLQGFDRSRARLSFAAKMADDGNEIKNTLLRYASKEVRAGAGILEGLGESARGLTPLEASEEVRIAYNKVYAITEKLAGTVEEPGSIRRLLGYAPRAMPRASKLMARFNLEGAASAIDKLVKEGKAGLAIKNWWGQFLAAEEQAKKMTGDHLKNLSRGKRFWAFCVKHKWKAAVVGVAITAFGATYYNFEKGLSDLEDTDRLIKALAMDPMVAQAFALDSDWRSYALTVESVWLEAQENEKDNEGQKNFEYPTLFEMVAKNTEAASDLTSEILESLSQSGKEELKQLESAAPVADPKNLPAPPTELTAKEKEELDDQLVKKLTQEDAQKSRIFLDEYQALIKLIWIQAKAEFMTDEKKMGMWDPENSMALSTEFATVFWTKVFEAAQKLSERDPKSTFSQLPWNNVAKGGVVDPKQKNKHIVSVKYGKNHFISSFVNKTKIEQWEVRKRLKNAADDRAKKAKQAEDDKKKADEAAAGKPAEPATPPPAAPAVDPGAASTTPDPK